MLFQKVVTLLYLAVVVQGQFTFETSCFIGNSLTPCDSYEPVGGNIDCNVDLKYQYTITNEIEVPIRVQGIAVDDGDTLVNPMISLNQTPIIKNGVVTGEYEVTKNFCDLDGKVISHTAIAVASSIDDYTGEDISTTDGAVLTYVSSAAISFTARSPNPAQLEWVMSESGGTNASAECFIDGKSGSLQTCDAYARSVLDNMLDLTYASDECIQDVIFKYRYTITGTGCYSITSVESKLEVEGNYKSFPLDDNLFCNERRLCKDDFVEVDDKQTVDFCVSSDLTVDFIGKINGAPLNDSKTVPYTFPGVTLSVPRMTSPPTTAPTAAPNGPPTTLAPAPEARTECKGHPVEMYFVYLGPEYTCDKSNNGSSMPLRQEKKNKGGGSGKGVGKGAGGSTGDIKKTKKGKNDKNFVCNDQTTITNDRPFIIVSDSKDRIYFKSGAGGVDLNECITASPKKVAEGKSSKGGSKKMPGTTYVRIKNPVMDVNGDMKKEPAQMFMFHSSCSTPFYTGDTFGALKLIGWKNKSGRLFGSQCEDTTM